ncbi:ABC transporter permease [Nitrincola tapanii]|uniref:FtsX-like permease family protein n=1 Tax=Nitrincola tapanii TaxID=1708751 RepID=A0A5A9W7L2_9GAMM|nr:FtsX-like permease family protein [Nitrincola tapanii]KAA0876185.1 FtsX-like permease family protein [Nitrincola tapanii]
MTLLTRLSWQQFRRQLRTTEWRALLLATWIAITLTTLLALLGDRLERGLLRESAALLGADLVLSSQRPLDPQRLTALLESTPVEFAEVVQFPTMLSKDEEMMLASLRAAQPPYPLRGQLQTQPQLGHSFPQPGELWVERRILEQLGLNLGDLVDVGYQSLKVTAELVQSPDRGSGFRSFSPQAIMHAEDLAASGVLAPGSRAEFRWLFAGDAEPIRELTQALQASLLESERLFSLTDDQPMTGNALGSALNYLKLAALIALLLSALTIYLSLKRFSQEQHSRCALLLSLGMTPRQLSQVYAYQFVYAWIGLSCLGLLSGALLDLWISQWLNQLLPQGLPQPSTWLYFSGSALGAVMLFLLGLPPTLQLAGVSVTRLFREEELVNSNWLGRLLPLLCLGLLALTLLAFLRTPVLSLGLLLILLVVGSVFGWVAQLLLLAASRVLSQPLRLGRLLRMRMRQQRAWHRLQAGVVVLLLTLLSVIWISRNDLLEDWQNQIPADTPNYFLVNIQPFQTQPLSDFLTDRSIHSQLYPMVRGRLLERNGEPIREGLSAEQQEHNTLNRELNLSWSDQLPAHNQLVSGDWWPAASQEAEISIEQEMAQVLELNLGDQLLFDLGGVLVEARIRNIRQVDWGSFQPNFYVIFNAQALQTQPATFITSFRLSTDATPLLRELLSEFPALTLIDIDQLLQQINLWLGRLADSSALILLLSLVSGALLLIVTLKQALEQRRYEGALLQTLGASATDTQRLDLLEFVLLGLICGALAAFTAELTLSLIYVYLLKIPASWHPGLWLTLPLLSASFFSLCGFLLRRSLSLMECFKILRRH